VCGGFEAARSLLAGLRLARAAVTLGGPDTLVSHSATSTHLSVLPEVKAATGITEGLVRLSVGLEAFDDIRDDFAAALG
jgi:cystathionine beta-lyase/cystathionine gamma-synthase